MMTNVTQSSAAVLSSFISKGQNLQALTSTAASLLSIGNNQVLSSTMC